ncbi:protein-glutamine gamma-glutamyltransferase [Niallia sp. Krafla_26]|uniref:protein-glutamine gamma-glutamyltransferase n=1 Tax=Niallia sp. Krafla_26 TaxID=3064703 RepID=UPI003D170C32
MGRVVITLIQVSGISAIPENLTSPNSVEKIIFQALKNDPNFYYYESINDLLFELSLRKNIISSAILMSRSSVSFEVFSTSRCNPKYWHLTSNGGFSLKSGVFPSEAIEDIFKNGSLYGFECATAIMIIYYHAVLKSIDQSLFNQLFRNLYLYSWHADSDLGIHSKNMDYIIPGDVVYFNNPDVNPRVIWLRGENAVLLSDGRFFAHGVGIQTGKEIIRFLNENRKPGSTISAYQTQYITRPAFNYLSQFSRPMRVNPSQTKFQYAVIHHNQPSISCEQYYNFLTRYYQ